MKLILLVRGEDSEAGAVKILLPGEYFILEAGLDAGSRQLLRNIVLGLVLVDINAAGVVQWMKEACRLRPDLAYVGIGDRESARSMSDYFFDFIYIPFDSWQVRSTLERAWEMMLLRSGAAGAGGAGRGTFQEGLPNGIQNGGFSFSAGGAFQGGGYPPHRQRGRVLGELSRALGSSFSREKLLDLFMDAVVELVPVGKLSVLLFSEEAGVYTVAKQRGLDPALLSILRFKPEEGLMSWLMDEGRICYPVGVEGAGGDSSGELAQEMKLLQAVVCVPMMAYGKLVGALALGPKVTGSPFYEDELELLYIMCTNVAIAVRDIELHQRLYYQKIYTESILQRMNSGVAAISREETVTTFNSRAGEILSLNPDQVLGRDLRGLPSPLGDLLYETLSSGRAYHKEEVVLSGGQLPLEISTYRLTDEKGEVLGSVMVFDDISERKKSEQERRQSDQLDVLNKFVGQLAHEIKNPMVAIQTFSEMLPEKYEDGSFREFFTHTVRQEVKRLNELVEQLIAFSSPLSYRFTVTDVHEILDASLLLLHEQGKGENASIESSYCGERLEVKADKMILARAFAYLFNYYLEVLQGGGTIYIETSRRDSMFQHCGVYIAFSDSGTKVEEKDIEKMFDPVYIEQGNHISLGLPVGRKIIEDHGGELKASQARGKCLKFEVFLPLVSGAEGGRDDGDQA